VLEKHHLSDEERVRIGLQVDAMITVMAERYGVKPSQIIDAVHWVEHHREFVSSLKKGGLLSMFGIMISAGLLALWEGVKAFIKVKGQ